MRPKGTVWQWTARDLFTSARTQYASTIRRPVKWWARYLARPRGSRAVAAAMVRPRLHPTFLATAAPDRSPDFSHPVVAALSPMPPPRALERQRSRLSGPSILRRHR